jgi:hypothetical protein
VLGFSLASLAFDIYQVVDAVGAANRYNRRHGLDTFAMGAPPVGLSVGNEDFAGFSSARSNSLFMQGNAGREMAVGLSASRAVASPWTVHANMKDLAVTTSYSMNF